jgi:hypothetical protein
LLPCSLQQLVYDKEKRLRMMMKMHGLNDTVYWLVNYCWYYILYAIYVIIFCVLGAIVQLEVFRKTSIGERCSQTCCEQLPRVFIASLAMAPSTLWHQAGSCDVL